MREKHTVPFYWSHPAVTYCLPFSSKPARLAGSVFNRGTYKKESKRRFCDLRNYLTFKKEDGYMGEIIDQLLRL